jgi:hypothetical protein
MTRNPKKAAILGLLAVVAMYFWVPLVWGWIGPKEAAGMPAPNPASVNSPSHNPEAKATGATPAATYTWEQLVEWRRNDPLAEVTKTLASRRDPFHPVRPKAAAAEKEKEKEKAQEALQTLLTPEALGLRLSSTMVGPERRVALINGAAYLEGQSVRCVKDGLETTFEVAEVHPRKIVLEREGHRFELVIRQKSFSDRIGRGDPNETPASHGR